MTMGRYWKALAFRLAFVFFAILGSAVNKKNCVYCFVPCQRRTLRRGQGLPPHEFLDPHDHKKVPPSRITTTTALSVQPQFFGEWFIHSSPLAWIVLLNLAAAIAGWGQLQAIQSKWDPRLDVGVNLIFALVPNKMQISKPIIDEDNNSEEMSKHVEELRKMHLDGMKNLPSVSLPLVKDVSVPRSDGGKVAVRLYYPNEDSSSSVSSPWILYCHGGGWVMGSIESHDAFCRQLASRSGVVVASVEYRLAPDFQHPIPRNDCWDALNGLLEQSDDFRLDAGRVGIAGDSSGGTIAAQVALQARDRQIPLRLQLLLCPALDPSGETASYTENETAPGLLAKDMRWLWRRHLPRRYYEGGDDETGGDANVMRVANLSGVASAVIIAAEADVLRDEAQIYSNRLKDAGVPVTYQCYKGAIHAFCVYANTPLALGDVALDDAVSAIQDAMKTEKALKESSYSPR